MWTSGKQESIESRKGGWILERWNSGTEGEFHGRIHRIGRTVGEYTGADHPVVSVYIRLPLSSVPAFQINSFRGSIRWISAAGAERWAAAAELAPDGVGDFVQLDGFGNVIVHAGG